MSDMHLNTRPCSAGIGFKPDYIEQAINSTEQGLWFEVHTENYLVNGGVRLTHLEQLRSCAPLSFHGVSASLGGKEPLDASFLSKVRQLVDRFEPQLVSEHAVWSRNAADYYPDLLPLPRTQKMMRQLIDGVSAYQEAIGRSILLENPSNYLNLISEMDEVDFMLEVAKRSGCGLLLDVNNLYLSSVNCGLDVQAYIDALPSDLVGEIHIAGHSIDPEFGNQLLIDSHDHLVAEPVWKTLEYALQKLGAVPVLLERDDNLPSWTELMTERNRAQLMLDAHRIECHRVEHAIA